MAENALKSIHNWGRYPALKCYEIDENLQFWIQRCCSAIWCRT